MYQDVTRTCISILRLLSDILQFIIHLSSYAPTLKSMETENHCYITEMKPDCLCLWYGSKQRDWTEFIWCQKGLVLAQLEYSNKYNGSSGLVVRVPGY
jgi:hypothetical protein